MTRRPAPTRSFTFRLNPHSGVPVYRQLIDQVQAATATGTLLIGNQLPTVRQVAVDLAINPNTVLRAYREMEIRGLLETQQGSGSFIAQRETAGSPKDQRRQLTMLVEEFISRAGLAGFSVEQLLEAVEKASQNPETKRKLP